MVRTRWRESGIGRSWRGWVGMVLLEGDRWKGLCTEWVILNEDGWQRTWAKSMALRRQFSTPGGGGTVCLRTMFWGRDAKEVSQWEVGVSPWKVGESQWEVGVSQWEVEMSQWEIAVSQWE